MRTPAGKECKYFYGNYFRGRKTEECRLLRESAQSWTASPVHHLPRAGCAAGERLRVSTAAGGGEATA